MSDNDYTTTRETLGEGVIAYQRCFATLTGSVTAALLLSQAAYWSKRTTLKDGWFYKTAEEWRDETGLSRHEMDTARRKTKRWLESHLRGVPARLHWRVDWLRIHHDLSDPSSPYWKRVRSSLPESGKLVCRDPASLFDGNQQTISETTAEITRYTDRRFQRPSVSELKAYGNEIGFTHFDPQEFVDFYESKGWKVGKTAMKDWKAAVRNWRRHAGQFTRKPPPIKPATRQDKINRLNKRKAELTRKEPKTTGDLIELEQIRIQLHEL